MSARIAATAASQAHTFAEQCADDRHSVGTAAAIELGPDLRGKPVDHAQRSGHVNIRAILSRQPERSLGDVAAGIAGAGEEGAARIRFHEGANDAP
jgi:hypothetical protein